MCACARQVPHKEACVLVATYNMITHSGPRAQDTKAVLADIEGREWGLLLMDEVPPHPPPYPSSPRHPSSLARLAPLRLARWAYEPVTL